MTCGAKKKDGSPCQQPAGWGRETSDGPCKYHVDQSDSGQSGRSGRQRARDDRPPAADKPWGEPQIRRILDALRDGATYEIAARAAGTSPRTFRRWRANHDDLRQRVERAEAEGAEDALDVVRKAADEGDWRAASWLLERRHGYDGEGDGLEADEVREFVECVQGVIRDELPDQTAGDVIAKIGAALEELTDA